MSAQWVLLTGLAAVLAAATCAYAAELNCAIITGCAQCEPVTYNATEAALRFLTQKTQRAKVQAERQIQRAQNQLARATNKAAAATTGQPKGRQLKAIDSVDIAEVADATDFGIAVESEQAPGTHQAQSSKPAASRSQIDVFPSCTACAEGFSLVTKSVRGRPPMGRCECAAGYGIQYTTVSFLNKKGQTKLKKTFTCTKCDENSVPLTPAAGLKITNAGVVMLTEPIDVAAVEAAGQKVLRKDWLPGGAAKKFDLVPGQCVECPLGSVKSADGISCEADV